MICMKRSIIMFGLSEFLFGKHDLKVIMNNNAKIDRTPMKLNRYEVGHLGVSPWGKNSFFT